MTANYEYPTVIIKEVDLTDRVPSFSDSSVTIWGQRTLNPPEGRMDEIDTRGLEQTIYRQLETNWTLEDGEHLESMYEMDIPDSIIRRMVEQMRNSIDQNILENIVGVQPMEDDTLDGFFKMRKRKKLDLRLPDKLFEME